MSAELPPAAQGSSTRPYLIRALHEWCTDNGFTPYLAVHVDQSVQVPMEYVTKNEIVLNVGFEATSGLSLGNEWIEFKARFGGVPREIIVPVDHVVAIYARENGQGMAFPAPEPRLQQVPPQPTTASQATEPPSGVASLAAKRAHRDRRTSGGEADGVQASDDKPMPSPSAPPAVSLAPTPPSDAPEPDQPPPAAPPAGAGSRPALKRIK